MLIPFLNETARERDERIPIFRSREMRKGREREGYVQILRFYIYKYIYSGVFSKSMGRGGF